MRSPSRRAAVDLGRVVRLRGGDVAPVERDVGGDVGGMARPPGARAEEAAGRPVRRARRRGRSRRPPTRRGRRCRRPPRTAGGSGRRGRATRSAHPSASYMPRTCVSSGSAATSAQGEVDVALGEGELERGPEVVRRSAASPRSTARSSTPCTPRAAASARPTKYSACRRRSRRRRSRSRRVGAQGLQHAVAGDARVLDRHDHGLVHQRGHQVERVRLGDVPGSPQTACTRGEVGAAREHRHPREQPLLRLVQQPVGPVDRGGEALVAGLRGARRRGRAGGRRRAARRSRRRSSPACGRRPARCRAAGRRAAGRSRRPRRRRGRSRAGWPARAARTARRRPGAAAAAPATPARRRRRAAPGSWRARRRRGTAATMRCDQPRGGVQHVLAVVQHEQQRAGGEVLDDRLLDRRAVALLHPQRGRDGVRHGAAVGQRGQLGEPRAVGEPVALAARHLDREPGLPDAADADERDQRGRPQRLARPRRSPAPARPARCRGAGRLRGPGGFAGRERRVLLQHPAVQRAGGVGRLDAQLLDEAAAQILVDGQRVGLPPARRRGRA